MRSPTVDDLVGLSAGAVCRVLDNPAGSEIEAVVDAAQEIAYDSDRVMSAWTFVDLHPDGTTIWAAPDGRETAIVSADGAVQVTTF